MYIISWNKYTKWAFYSDWSCGKCWKGNDSASPIFLTKYNVQRDNWQLWHCAKPFDKIIQEVPREMSVDGIFGVHVCFLFLLSTCSYLFPLSWWHFFICCSTNSYQTFLVCSVMTNNSQHIYSWDYTHITCPLYAVEQQTQERICIMATPALTATRTSGQAFQLSQLQDSLTVVTNVMPHQPQHTSCHDREQQTIPEKNLLHIGTGIITVTVTTAVIHKEKILNSRLVIHSTVI